VLVSRTKGLKRAFTLIEVMVVVAVTATLISILLPALAGAREAGRAAACLSNLRQINTCLQAYAGDFKGQAPPGAADISANLRRWHGSRASASGTFAANGGSLSEYLAGSSVGVRECPTFAPVLHDSAFTGFERSCGGYGYNNAFLGVVRARAGASPNQVMNTDWPIVTDRTGSLLVRFASPASTIAFADTAFADTAAGAGVIEYSFVEPRFWPDIAGARADPSHHFRHHASVRGGAAAGSASTAWLDGHVSSERRTFTWSSGLYGEPAADPLTGWTGGSDDNALFDYD